MSYARINSEELALYLKDVRPEFKLWAWNAFVQGQLDLLLQAWIRSGKATGSGEALLGLAEYYYKLPKNGKNGKITWGDIAKSSGSSRLSRKLSELISGEKDYPVYDRSKYHGVISHLVIPELLSGNLINIEKSSRVKKLPEQPEQPEQMKLFSNGADNNDLFLFRALDKAKLKKTPLKRNLAIKLIERIEWERDNLVEEMKTGTLPFQSKNFPKFRKSLRRIFEGYMVRILNQSIMEGDYLSSLTFMTWASALSVYRWSGNLTFFSEIPVLPYNYDLGAGRMDAFFVRKINDAVPNLSQVKKIKAMTRRKFSSVGHIISGLLKLFGTHIEFKITDWKFAVGDGKRGMRYRANVIKSEEVEEKPLPEDERQMKRYLSMTVLSHALVSKMEIEDVKKIWETKSFTLVGEIVYFFPDRLPVFHDVKLSEEEVEAVFEEQVVSNFLSAKRRSTFRQASNILFNQAIKLSSGNSDRTHEEESLGSQFRTAASQLQIEGFEAPETPSVIKIIDAYLVRKFADETEIIEITGQKKGKPTYEMHLDRLLKAVDDGTVGARNFGARGGFVNCLMPDHGERTPSMSVSFSRGIFKCFGCGACGTFELSSIPEDVRVLIRPESIVRKHNSATEKLVIPLRHQEIMASAQSLLNNALPQSKGGDYLAKVRGLDPDSSFQIGAGFADENFISNLLDMGFLYDELIYYGFIGISPKISEYHKIVKLLKGRGLDLYGIRRPVKIKQKGQGIKTAWGLPYSILDNRVTYPLEIGGIINSFYGRSIDTHCDKRFIHRKLKTSGMPHGAFNMAGAMKSGASEILVTEGSIDADTFMQFSDCKSSTAIIGVNNEVLFEELAEFAGNIIVAFDNDPKRVDSKGRQIGETGQKNTVKLKESLTELGFKGQVYDFTANFVKKNPGIVYKDINNYWTTYRKPVSVLQTIDT